MPAKHAQRGKTARRAMVRRRQKPCPSRQGRAGATAPKAAPCPESQDMTWAWVAGRQYLAIRAPQTWAGALKTPHCQNGPYDVMKICLCCPGGPLAPGIFVSEARRTPAPIVGFTPPRPDNLSVPTGQTGRAGPRHISDRCNTAARTAFAPRGDLTDC
jgi:hypothetical protein